jgi:hypothetical protein
MSSRPGDSIIDFSIVVAMFISSFFQRPVSG